MKIARVAGCLCEVQQECYAPNEDLTRSAATETRVPSEPANEDDKITLVDMYVGEHSPAHMVHV